MSPIEAVAFKRYIGGTQLSRSRNDFVDSATSAILESYGRVRVLNVGDLVLICEHRHRGAGAGVACWRRPRGLGGLLYRVPFGGVAGAIRFDGVAELAVADIVRIAELSIFSILYCK